MSLRFLTAGDSHGESLDGIIEGLPAGLRVSVPEVKRELRRRDAIGRARPGIFGTLAGFGVGLGASALDPINVGAGFIPFIGQARYARLRAGSGTFLGRTATRAAVP